ncbi:MAG: hypothetical protein IT291_00660 [Deltaproteobacteria bacterium]|nr:hypothetical protein [Deltaproteobacteria bacterium]
MFNFQAFRFGVSNSAWRIPFSIGLFLVFLGVLIIAVPELLVAMLATVIIFSGFSLIILGLRLRKIEKKPSYSLFDTFEQ